MKANRTLVALFFAIAVHGLFLFLVWSAVRPTKTQTPPVQEKRFGVVIEEEPSLSEKSASLPPSVEIPPVLEKMGHRERTPPESQSVSSSEMPPQPLAFSDIPAPITPDQRDTLPRSVLYHYGEGFFDLSAGEQHFIIDNLQRIRKINEVVGTKLLRERYDVEIDPSDSNVVEFTLHPDGSLSDLHLHKNRVGSFLDELTLQTISLAHSRYPKPEQSTRIRIRVYIVVR